MDGDGWQISEVMALLGMGRRAIQRSCGQNPASGDLGIVRVEGGKPGRRSYGADELAQLHLVNAMNQDGMDLASVRDAFELARSSDGVECLAERRCELDLERAEAAEARLRRDRALASRGTRVDWASSLSGRSPPRWRGPGTRGRSRQAGFSPVCAEPSLAAPGRARCPMGFSPHWRPRGWTWQWSCSWGRGRSPTS